MTKLLSNTFCDKNYVYERQREVFYSVQEDEMYFISDAGIYRTNVYGNGGYYAIDADCAEYSFFAYDQNSMYCIKKPDNVVVKYSSSNWVETFDTACKSQFLEFEEYVLCVNEYKTYIEWKITAKPGLFLFLW